jgi:hypothetical protein
MTKGVGGAVVRWQLVLEPNGFTLTSFGQFLTDGSWVVLGIWVGLFGLARARPENKSPKHGPARNNMGRANTARSRVWAGPQIPTRRAPARHA